MYISKYRSLTLVIIGFLGLILFGVLQVNHTVIPQSVPAVLNLEAFPLDQVDYPEDWPAHLIYPPEFILVSASSGVLPIDNTAGWITRLRYRGVSEVALEEITIYFEETGWLINESVSIEGGGTLQFVANQEFGAGIIIIEPDLYNPGQSLISVTIYN